MTDQTPTVQQRLRDLARAALDSTRAGNLSWRTMDDEDAFLFAGNSYSLIIDWYPEAGFYALKLTNPRGTVVDRLEGRPGAADPWATPPNTPLASPDFTLLSELHDAARRSALNIDDLLNEALSDILSGQAGDERQTDEPPWYKPDPPF